MSYLDDEELKIGSIDEEDDLGLDDDLGGPIHDDFTDDLDEEDLGLADLNGSEY